MTKLLPQGASVLHHGLGYPYRTKKLQSVYLPESCPAKRSTYMTIVAKRGEQILSADIERKHEDDTYGEVKGGSLTFRAQLFPLTIERKLCRRESSRGISERRSIS